MSFGQATGKHKSKKIYSSSHFKTNMKIYTKTGDRGKTSLFDGSRVAKNNPRVDAYGTIDELNSTLGVVLSFIQAQTYAKEFKKYLEQIQNNLFAIGSYLANPSVPKDADLAKKLTHHTQELEKFIDNMTEKLPELSNFILPGGEQVGAFLHIARAVVRRAERLVVGLSAKAPIESSVIIYLNRLSDVFFTMSRFANYKEEKKEVIWKK